MVDNPCRLQLNSLDVYETTIFYDASTHLRSKLSASDIDVYLQPLTDDLKISGLMD